MTAQSDILTLPARPTTKDDIFTMSADHPVSRTDFVERFTTAETLEKLPSVIDVALATPANPPAHIQAQFVGATYRDAYEEAASFLHVVKQWSGKHGRCSLQDARRILDFGSGWGRISRFLLTTTQPDRLVAADVDLQMTALIGQTLPGVNAITLNPLPPSMLGDATVDVVTAFSVFSHLAPHAHEAWAHEFGRVTSDGAIVVITVLDDAFFAQLQSAKDSVDAGEPNEVAKSLATLFDDLAVERTRFDNGEFVYAGNGGGGPLDGDFYGWAAAPQAYVARIWSEAGFEVVEWVPANVLFPQAAVCLRRRPRSEADSGPRMPAADTSASLLHQISRRANWYGHSIAKDVRGLARRRRS